MCSDPNDVDKIYPALYGFWAETLKASHPAATQWFDKIDPDSWHAHFLSRIGSAAEPIPVFRHIEEDLKLCYKKTNEITPEEWQLFVNQVNLPGNKKGEFKKDAFDKAVAAVVNTWGGHLFVDIENNKPDGPSTYIRNWDLDTGVG